jgi:hypothetical protein
MLLDAGRITNRLSVQSHGANENRRGLFIAPVADKNGKRHYKVIEHLLPVS